MRLRGRQGRFIALVVTGWVGARTWLLWPVPPAAADHRVAASAAAVVPADWMSPVAGRVAPASLMASASSAAARHAQASTTDPAIVRHEPRHNGDHSIMLAQSDSLPPAPGARENFAPARAMRAADTPAPPLLPVRASANRAIEASAYLFVRPGSGRAALAPGGSLGGSQIAARIALPLGRVGPLRAAAAGRLYAPLAGKGREAALGLDLRPLRDVPLRLVVERRIGLDAVGRDAWSAYAADGFFSEPLPKLAIDGYAQAGIVGLRARDLFADGALRIGRRAGRLTLGAGLWGAAQPGVERIDVGPRAALALPVAGHGVTLAIEGRLRVAGQAAPGSGAALTLAADF